MSERVRRLRGEAKRFTNGTSPTATRYSAEFRDEVLSLARERGALGMPVARIAAELGVRSQTLTLWLRSAPKRHLRRVKVAPEIATLAPAAPAFAVSVGAMRVEGLDLESLVRLVRALA